MPKPRRVCPFCNKNSCSLTPREQSFPYGEEPNQVMLTATVPVWTCHACKAQFTDGDAEQFRDEAVKQHQYRKALGSTRVKSVSMVLEIQGVLALFGIDEKGDPVFNAPDPETTAIESLYRGLYGELSDVFHRFEQHLINRVRAAQEPTAKPAAKSRKR